MAKKNKNKNVIPEDQRPAIQGSETAGTNIGKLSEFTAAEIEPAKQAEFKEFAPVTNVTGQTIDQTQEKEFRDRQVRLAQALEDQMLGKTPSLAEAQMKAETDRGISQQMAIAKSQRGSPTLRNKAALSNTAAMSQAAAQQAGILRLQEVNAAQSALAGVTDQGRQSDQLYATNQAKLLQQADESNALAANTRSNQIGVTQNQLEQFNTGETNTRAARQAELVQQANQNRQNLIAQRAQTQASINQAIEQARISAAAQMGAASIGASASRYATDAGLYKFNMGTAIDITNRQTANNIAYDQAGNSAAMAGQQASNGFWGGMINAGGAMGASMLAPAAAASDEREKKDIKPADKKIQSFLDALEAFNFKYKNPANGEGEQTGVMAQDLEKTEVGSKMVEETPEGTKMINFGKGLGVLLAAQAELNERLKALEKRKAA